MKKDCNTCDYKPDCVSEFFYCPYNAKNVIENWRNYGIDVVIKLEEDESETD